MSVSVAIKNACETTGEGPHWQAETSSLLFVDILNGGVHRWNSSSGEHTQVHLGSPVGFVVPSVRGDLAIGLARTISRLDFETVTTETMVEVEQGTNNRFNDGKCDPHGRLWAGTMGHEVTPGGEIERQRGSLYSLDKERYLSTHASHIDISNGLAWSSDNQTFFYIDSLPRKLYAYDYDLQPGTVRNQRVAVDFESIGIPDGMCIDVHDRLWVACYNGGKVVCVDPVTGQIINTVEFPVKRVTSCCFGGPQLDELYVTSGKAGLSEVEFSVEQPLAGSVFKVTGLGVKGVPSQTYQG